MAAGCLLWAGSLTGRSATEATPAPRQFIAHRGVHLRSTIAGENSLEAIQLARRAGFATIETDVRLTADGQLVVMHDETLNRTCLAVDGAKLKEPVAVAKVTLAALKANYVLQADDPKMRTRVPTLREYLEECRRQALLPFIEPKLKDATGAHYRKIIEVADDVLGRGGYIITSNNEANRVIRSLGIKDVRLMGILYQTTFEEIAGLGNTIMAISATRFSAAEFSTYATRAIAAGLATESHADDYARFAVINAHPIDFVSTDRLAPDRAAGVKPWVSYEHLSDFDLAGLRAGGGARLTDGGRVALKRPLPKVAFGGIFLELELKGSGTVRLADQEFTVEGSEGKTLRHQLMIYDTAPEFAITARGDCEVKRISLKLVVF